MPPINCFPTNRPQCRSTILLGGMLLTLYDCVGILKSTDDLGEQLFFSDVRGFSMSHIAGVSVQGAHTDFDWHGRFGLCHKFSSLLFSVPGFPIVFYNDWGWHEWLIIFTKALTQQGIKKRCCSITTQLHFDGFCQLPPKPQQMCFIWLFTTSSCVFRTTFYRDNTEIDHQAETEASSPSRNFFWKSPPLWAKKMLSKMSPEKVSCMMSLVPPHILSLLISDPQISCEQKPVVRDVMTRGLNCRLCSRQKFCSFWFQIPQSLLRLIENLLSRKSPNLGLQLMSRAPSHILRENHK